MLNTLLVEPCSFMEHLKVLGQLRHKWDDLVMAGKLLLVDKVRPGAS